MEHASGGRGTVKIRSTRNTHETGESPRKRKAAELAEVATQLEEQPSRHKRERITWTASEKAEGAAQTAEPRVPSPPAATSQELRRVRSNDVPRVIDNEAIPERLRGRLGSLAGPSRAPTVLPEKAENSGAERRAALEPERRARERGRHRR